VLGAPIVALSALVLDGALPQSDPARRGRQPWWRWLWGLGSATARVGAGTRACSTALTGACWALRRPNSHEVRT